jgi:hypothetical protein
VSDYREYRNYPHIRTPEDLGIACLGNPHTAIVPTKRRIGRADRGSRAACRVGWEYGSRLAETEGGIFTPQGYTVPIMKGA